MIFSFILLFLLIVRIAYLQFAKGETLKHIANATQTTIKTIEAERGTIFDVNGKVLAISANVDTVSINPADIAYSNDKEVDKEFLAESFSNIFALNYDETLKDILEKTHYYTLASKVETDKITKLRDWMKLNKIYSGIKIDSAVKRYYPYNTLASNLIGFTGTDNIGLWGLESSLDSILRGTNGKLVTLTDAIKKEIPNQDRTHIKAKNGSNIYLTIDVNIQSASEKYLAQAVDDNNADKGVAIVMRPSSGDILAMANYPNYDLNTPFTPINPKLLANWDNLTPDERANRRYSMWNNTAVQSTYEPGSTFKVITAATGLEEGIVEADHYGDFNCIGYEVVANRRIHCWKKYNPHGLQSLKDALANSCNPAFMQLGMKIGAKTLYKYYDAFGLFDKTNPYFYGEQNSIFFDLDDIHDVELATISFGQRFNITPIQLISAVSSIANQGVLVQPQIIRKIEDVNNNSIQETEVKKIRQVVSKKTAEELMDMLEYVVTDGTGGYAKVNGYTVGGKSGTSEPIDGNDGAGFIASFIGVAPTSNPELIVLIILFNPKGDNHHGGNIAAPVVSQILSEALPYLDIAPDKSITSVNKNTFDTHVLPDVKNRTLKDGRDALKNAGFTVHLNGAEDLSTIITEQNPKPGVNLLNDADVYLYGQKPQEKTHVSVPHFKGMSAAEARNSAKSKNLNLILEGSGIVISQDTTADTSVEVGSVITLTLSPKTNGGY